MQSNFSSMQKIFSQIKSLKMISVEYFILCNSGSNKGQSRNKKNDVDNQGSYF